MSAAAATFASTYVLVSDGPEVEQKLRSGVGSWLGAHVAEGLFWPTKACSVRFEGRELILCPGDPELYPAVFYQYQGKNSDDAHRLISKFLSAVSWMDERPARIEGWTGGSRPFRQKRGRYQTVRDHFRYDYLPQNLKRDARLALAFYREAMGLEHPAYAFLSFYKVINLRFPQGKAEQKKWMAATLPNLKDADARKRIAELQGTLSSETIDSYLYASCRCAVAHASATQTTVDPEDPIDQRRMNDDLPLIRALAVELVRSEYGVPTRHDVWQTKDYVLEGIRWMLGDAEVASIREGADPSAALAKMPQFVNVRTWGHAQLPTFARLFVHVDGVKDGAVYCELRSGVSRAGLVMAFDLNKNAIIFEPLADIVVEDDGSAKAASAIIDALTLRWEFLRNGSVEVWSEDNAICLARGDAYIPVNVFINPKGHEAEMKTAREVLEARTASEGSSAGKSS